MVLPQLQHGANAQAGDAANTGASADQNQADTVDADFEVIDEDEEKK